MTGRYWIFAGDKYYPLGGAEDLKGATDDADVARLACREHCTAHLTWAHVYDSVKGRIVYEAYNHRGELRDAELS